MLGGSSGGRLNGSLSVLCVGDGGGCRGGGLKSVEI